jgi:hypothetical protein
MLIFDIAYIYAYNCGSAQIRNGVTDMCRFAILDPFSFLTNWDDWFGLSLFANFEMM